MSTWIAATVVVWVVTAVGSWVLPLIFLRDKDNKDKRGKKKAQPSADASAA